MILLSLLSFVYMHLNITFAAQFFIHFKNEAKGTNYKFE